MTPDQILKWRPRRFADVIGMANRPAVEALQTAARARRTLKRVLVGPVGTAKTSLARLLLQSYCCERPDPATADPCHTCAGCRAPDPQLNSDGRRYQHWAFDCGQGVDKATVVGFLRTHRFAEENAVLFDELGDLPVPAQKALLGYLHDLAGGLFVATLTRDSAATGLPNLVGPLADRLLPVDLARPTPAELVAFLAARCREWHVAAEPAALNFLVRDTGGSFRRCLEHLAVAAERADRALVRPDPDGESFVLSPEPYPAPGASHSPFTGDGW